MELDVLYGANTPEGLRKGFRTNGDSSLNTAATICAIMG